MYLKYLKRLQELYGRLHWFSRLAIQLGLATMICVYITAGFAYVIAPYVSSYLQAMTVHYSAMEVAPACLAASVCSALICDIAWRTFRRNDSGSDE